MNRLQRWAMKAVGAKALESAVYPRSGMYGFDWLDAFDLKTPTDDDFAKAVKQAHKSSVVMSCVEFLVENATSTPWQLRDEDGEIIEEHPVLDLLRNPLPEMDGIALMAGWLQSLSLDGNAYAVILPARSGEIGGLQYIPHTAMKVGTGSKGEPTHFIYRVDGSDIRLPLDEVIHIRRYADWERIRYGRSPIAALGPEIWIDMEAARMVAAIMKKRGMPGGMIAPKPMQEDNQPLLMSPEDLQANREYMRKEYTGDKRGDWMMFGFPMDAHIFQYDPRIFDMSKAHNLAEERISSAFGIPAAVVGLDAGLRNTRVGATQSSFERQAWQGGVIPMQHIIAQACTRALLGEENLTLEFDLSSVTSLQEDENAKVERLTQAVQGGWMPVSEAKKETGQEVLPTDEVYLRSVSVQEVPVGQSELDRAREAMALRPDMEEETPNDDEEDDDEDEDTPPDL